LAAPFKPKDAALFSVISSFDSAYSAYNEFQSGLERYWALRHLEQQGLGELDAAVMKDGLVRAETLPLVFRALGTESLPRGERVRVRITGIDLLTLDLHASLLVRLGEAEAAAVSETEAEAEDEEEAAASHPLSLAIDVADATDEAEAAGGGSNRAPGA
jgi:exoribonuclease-2